MSINLWGLGIATQSIKYFCACLCLKILLLGHICRGGKTTREMCLLHREEVVLPPAMTGKAAKCFSPAGASRMRGHIFSHSYGMGSASGSWSHILCFALSDLLLIQKCRGIKLLKNQKQVYHWGLEKFYLNSSLRCFWAIFLQAAPSTVSQFLGCILGGRIHPVWLSILSYPTCLGLFVVCVLAIAQVTNAFHVE